MIQLVKFRPHKHEDSSLDLQDPWDKLGCGVW